MLLSSLIIKYKKLELNFLSFEIWILLCVVVRKPKYLVDLTIEIEF